MAVETVDAAVLERIIKAQGAPVRKTFLDAAITASCVPDRKHNERFSDVQIFDQADRCGFCPAVHNWGEGGVLLFWDISEVGLQIQAIYFVSTCYISYFK